MSISLSREARKPWRGSFACTLLFACGAALPAFAQNPAAAAEPAARSANDADELAEIVVTGTRLQSGFETPTPVTTLSAENLQLRGVATVMDGLDELPVFRNPGGMTRGTGGSFAVGQSIVDLRGLGAFRTLALIDGRRHVPNNVVGANAGTWDTNVLPTALLERVDVVTGGASAAYGSDAVAGVVNFIINDRLQGIKGNVQYGDTQNGEYGQFLVNLAAGNDFAGGRGHFVVGADYLDASKSDFALDSEIGNDRATYIALGTNRPAGTPANVLVTNASMSIPLGGRVLNCSTGGAFTPCPAGIANLTFNQDGTPRPFQFGSLVGATQMAGGEGTIFYRNQVLGVGANRVATLARANYEFTPSLTGFAELGYGRFHVENNTVDYVNAGSIIIQRDNPYLPAALATQMDAGGITRFTMARTNYDSQRGVRANSTNDFWQGAVGLRGKIFGDWTWDGYYSQGKAEFFYQLRGLTALPEYFAALYAVRDAGGNIVCGPTATNPMYAALAPAQRTAFLGILTTGCVPFNPFGPNADSAAARAYVTSETIHSVTTYDQKTAAINLAGSPFSTWAGDASLAVGVEWRDEKVASVLDPLDNARVLVSAYHAANPQPGAGQIDVTEGYLEAGIPMLRDKPGATALDLNAAARFTEYSESGSVTTWKLGATWDITDALRVRATRSRDIRAPSIPELFYKGNDGFAVITNPVTLLGNQINQSAVGNRNLKPEEANSWTAGIVFQPTWNWARGLSGSLDYYSIKVDGVVGTLTAAEVINGYYLQGRTEYAQYITFDASQPSGIRRLDIPQTNLNALEVAGVDLNLSYAMPEEFTPGPGRMSFDFVGSYLQKQITTAANGAILSDLAVTTPKRRFTANINYKLGSFSTTLTARYSSSFKASFTLIGPDDPRYNPASPLSISDNIWPGWVSYSLQGEYKLRDADTQQWVAYLIVNNLFDRAQPLGAYWTTNGLGSPLPGSYNPYDNFRRSYKAGMRFSF